MEEQVTVILVDDHEIFRFGLEAMLERIENIKVIGQANSSQALFKLIPKEEPDIIFMDIHLGNESGIEITKKVLAKYPDTYVIAMTSSDEVSNFKEMVEAGAVGFLIKTLNENELRKAVQEILKGNQYFAKEFMTVARAMLPRKTQKSHIQITDREKEVLQLVSHGYSNQEIADQLDISYHTADAFRRKLITKTHARNTAEMIMISFREGLIEPE